MRDELTVTASRMHGSWRMHDGTPKPGEDQLPVPDLGAILSDTMTNDACSVGDLTTLPQRSACN